MPKSVKTLVNSSSRSNKSSKESLYDTEDIIDYHSASAKKNTLKKRLTKLFRDSKYNLILAMINAGSHFFLTLILKIYGTLSKIYFCLMTFLFFFTNRILKFRQNFFLQI